MSIRALAQQPYQYTGLSQQGLGAIASQQKPVQALGMPRGDNPFQQAQLQAQNPPTDQLAQFINQMRGGMIKSDLNKPALPATAHKSWSA